CALPRPSAIASAKFANRMVNHSHKMIWNSKPICWPPLIRSRIRITVVSAVTISSTNITGFLISVLGSSFTKAEPIAGTTIFGSNKAETGMRLRIWEVSMEVALDKSLGSIRRVCRSGGHGKMLDDGPERQRREEGEATNDQNHAHH